LNKIQATHNQNQIPHNKRFKSVSDGSDESLGSPLGSDLDDVFLDVLSNGAAESHHPHNNQMSNNMQTPGTSFSFPPEPDFDNDLKNGNVVKGHLVTLKGKDGQEKVFFLDPSNQFHPVIGANLTPVAIKVRFFKLLKLIKMRIVFKNHRDANYDTFYCIDKIISSLNIRTCSSKSHS
jgi:hypothetical protein